MLRAILSKTIRTWSIGTNNLYRTANLHIEDTPWYAWVVDEAVGRLCDRFPAIDLPDWPIVAEGEQTTLREWYGDTRQMFHLFVCDRVFNWRCSVSEQKFIPLDFETLEKSAPDMIFRIGSVEE